MLKKTQMTSTKTVDKMKVAKGGDSVVHVYPGVRHMQALFCRRTECPECCLVNWHRLCLSLSVVQQLHMQQRCLMHQNTAVFRTSPPAGAPVMVCLVSMLSSKQQCAQLWQSRLSRRRKTSPPRSLTGTICLGGRGDWDPPTQTCTEAPPSEKTWAGFTKDPKTKSSF